MAQLGHELFSRSMCPIDPSCPVSWRDPSEKWINMAHCCQNGPSWCRCLAALDGTDKISFASPALPWHGNLTSKPLQNLANVLQQHHLFLSAISSSIICQVYILEPRQQWTSMKMTQSSKISKQYIYIDIIYIYIYIPGWFCLPIITWSLFQNGILRIPKHQSKPRVDSFILLDPIGSYWLISYEIFISRWAIQDASEELNPLRRQWSPTSWQLSWHLVELVIQDCAWKLGLIPRSEGMIRGNSS